MNFEIEETKEISERNYSQNILACVTARKLGAASFFAAKEDVRFYLMGVYIEPLVSGGVLLTGTDGHSLFCVYDPDGYTSRPFIFPVEHNVIPSCGKLPTKKQIETRSELQKIHFQDGIVTSLSTTHAETNESGGWEARKEFADYLVQSPFMEIDGKFPDTSKIVPVFKESDKANLAQTLTFNPLHLYAFYKAGKLLSGNAHIGITTRSQSETSSIAIRFATGQEELLEAFGLVMPMRPGIEFSLEDQIPKFYPRAAQKSLAA